MLAIQASPNLGRWACAIIPATASPLGDRMELQVVGAGLGRTGTTSLKAALEQLLGGPCYHMVEVSRNPGHMAIWQAAGEGDLPDWDELFDGYVGVVDWPGASFWPEIAQAYPDAPVLLSTRRDADTWWRSADTTIFGGWDRERADPDELLDMWEAIVGERFTSRWREREPAIEAYERHNAAVRAGVGPDRLVEHQPGDGWSPLCSMLGLPVPDGDYPRLNTTEDWAARRDDPPVER